MHKSRRTNAISTAPDPPAISSVSSALGSKQSGLLIWRSSVSYRLWRVSFVTRSIEKFGLLNKNPMSHTSLTELETLNLIYSLFHSFYSLLQFVWDSELRSHFFLQPYLSPSRFVL